MNGEEESFEVTDLPQMLRTEYMACCGPTSSTQGTIENGTDTRAITAARSNEGNEGMMPRHFGEGEQFMDEMETDGEPLLMQAPAPAPAPAPAVDERTSSIVAPPPDLATSTGSASVYHQAGDQQQQLNQQRQPRTLCMRNEQSGFWECRPYKHEILQEALDSSGGFGKTNIILETLNDLEVDQIHIVKATSDDILGDIRKVVWQVIRENQNGMSHLQRCILYEDGQRRLYNLVLEPNLVGPASTYTDLLDSFSGLQALSIFVVLCRSLPCAFSREDGSLDVLRPAYLSLILGLVFVEELSLAWINTAMLVRKVPSISAYTLTSNVMTDWLRKLCLFTLTVATAASDQTTQRVITMIGILMACLILLANIGSRSWHALRWKPFPFVGRSSQTLAFLAAVAAGMVVPHMAHLGIGAGGKGAVEYMFVMAVLVAIVFIVSDVDQVQAFLVVGSDGCNQDEVNIAVGIWWTVTVLLNLILLLRIPTNEQQQQLQKEGKFVDGGGPSDSEDKLLVPDHASPVGQKVPNLPDMPIDPYTKRKPVGPLALWTVVTIVVSFALALGAFMVWLGFTDVDDEFTSGQSFSLAASTDEQILNEREGGA